MADRKVSLIIAARDTASKTVQTMATAVSAHAKKIGLAFKAAGAAAQSIHAGLEIAKKVMAGLGAAYDRSIGKALELRAANDPAKKSITEMGEATDRLGAAVGNVLVPMLAAAAGALTPVINDAVKWLNTNRQLIGSNLVPWLTGVGKTLTSVVATGALLASKAYYGWAMAIGVVKDLASQAEAAYARDQAAFIRGTILRREMTAQARAGYEAQAAAFDAQAASATIAANKYAQDVGDAIAANESMGKTVDEVALKIQAGIGKAGDVALASLSAGAVMAGAKVADIGHAFYELVPAAVRAASQFGQAWGPALNAISAKMVGVGAAIIQAAEDADRSAFDAKIARQRQETTVTLAFNKQVAELQAAKRKEIADKETAETLARLTATRERVLGVSQSIASAGVSGLMSVLSGAENAGDALLGFFESVGNTILNTIAESAASAVASGLFDLLAGAVGGGAVGGPFGALFGAIGSIFGLQDGGLVGAIPAATGGLVIGGSAGVDSVPIMSMPGEYITPANEVRENVAAGRSPGDSGDSRGGRGGGGGSLTVVASAPTFMPESSADFDRRLNNALIPALRRLKRAGVVY